MISRAVALAAFLAFGAAPAFAQAVPTAPMILMKKPVYKAKAHASRRASDTARRVNLAPASCAPAAMPAIAQGLVSGEKKYLADVEQPAQGGTPRPRFDLRMLGTRAPPVAVGR